MRKRKEGKENTYSMTEGKLFPSFIVFLLPLIAAGFLQQSYSFVDGLILGNFINQNALGAVGSVGAIIDAGSLVQIALGSGCAIMVSHLHGAQKTEEVNRLIKNMRRLLTGISCILALAGILLADSFLMLLHTPENLTRGAALYMRICFLGIPFVSLYNLQAGILRGMGDSRHPLGGIAVSSVVNIGLDIIFVVIMRMGIAGAATATVAAEILSAVYLYYKLEQRRKDPAWDAGREVSNSKNDKANVAESIKLGAPQLVQSLATSGGMIMLQNVINMLGAVVVVGVVATFKIDSVLIAPLLGLGTAVSVFTGQNIGAGNHARVKASLRCGLITGFSISLLLTLILWGFGYPLFGLFGLEEDAAEYGYRYLTICLPFYWMFGMQFVLHGFLNGAKHTVITSFASVVGLALRIVFVYMGYRHFGGDILPVAEIASWTTCLVIDAIYIARLALSKKAI